MNGLDTLIYKNICHYKTITIGYNMNKIALLILLCSTLHTHCSPGSKKNTQDNSTNSYAYHDALHEGFQLFSKDASSATKLKSQLKDQRAACQLHEQQIQQGLYRYQTTETFPQDVCADCTCAQAESLIIQQCKKPFQTALMKACQRPRNHLAVDQNLTTEEEYQKTAELSQNYFSRPITADEIAVFHYVKNNKTTIFKDAWSDYLNNYQTYSTYSKRYYPEHFLYWAVYCDNKPVCDFLITNGFDINVPYNTGDTALYKAAQCGAHNIMETLIAFKAKSDGNSNALIPVVKNNDLQGVQILLHGGIDANIASSQVGVTALHAAARQNCKKHREQLPQIVKELLEHGADVNALTTYERPTTALDDALEHGNYDVAAMLLKHKDINVNIHNDKKSYKPEPPLITIIRHLKKHTSEETSSEKLDILQLIIAAGANLNVKDYYGHTALFLAADDNQLKAAEMLFSAGADGNAMHIPGCNNSTPLSRVIENGHDEFAETLIDGGAWMDPITIWRLKQRASFLNQPIKTEFLKRITNVFRVQEEFARKNRSSSKY